MENRNNIAARGLPVAGAAVLICILIFLTRGIVSLGAEPGLRLACEVLGYSAIAAGAVILARIWNLDLAFGPAKRRWTGHAAMALALIVVSGRFIAMQHDTDWPAMTGAEWLLLMEAYLVGRLVVPVAEEILFRGLLWSSLCRLSPSAPARAVLATLGSAIVFGALHWPGFHGLPTTDGGPIVLSAIAGGLVFGALRHATGSIRIGIALHIIGNSIGF